MPVNGTKTKTKMNNENVKCRKSRKGVSREYSINKNNRYHDRVGENNEQQSNIYKYITTEKKITLNHSNT